MDGWIYLRSLVLKEHRQSDANNGDVLTQKKNCNISHGEAEEEKVGRRSH